MNDDRDFWEYYLIGSTVLTLGLPALFWSQLTDWALRHGLIVAAQADPAVRLPYTSGAGFDTQRLVLAALVLAVVIAVLTQTPRLLGRRSA